MVFTATEAIGFFYGVTWSMIQSTVEDETEAASGNVGYFCGENDCG